MYVSIYMYDYMYLYVLACIYICQSININFILIRTLGFFQSSCISKKETDVIQRPAFSSLNLVTPLDLATNVMAPMYCWYSWQGRLKQITMQCLFLFLKFSSTFPTATISLKDRL